MALSLPLIPSSNYGNANFPVGHPSKHSLEIYMFKYDNRISKFYNAKQDKSKFKQRNTPLCILLAIRNGHLIFRLLTILCLILLRVYIVW